MTTLLHTALSAIKQLRGSVGQVFETIANGVRAEHGEEGKESKFLVEFQEQFNLVNLHLREVESADEFQMTISEVSSS